MDDSKKSVGVIDCTPTWAGILSWYIAVLEDGKTAEGREIAKAELLRMAKLADAYVEINKENDRLIQALNILTTMKDVAAIHNTINQILNSENNETKQSEKSGG